MSRWIRNQLVQLFSPANRRKPPAACRMPRKSPRICGSVYVWQRQCQGIADDKIILDPGVGFGKTYEMNLEIIDKLEIMQKLNYPILLGTSRKSVIGLTPDLPVASAGRRNTLTTVFGVQKGSAFVRVHDVKKNKRAIQMLQKACLCVTMRYRGDGIRSD